MINWFRKKSNSDDYESVVSDVPFSIVSRWYLYDTELTPDVNELAEMIGLSPVSEEGDVKEREDSEARMKELAPLLPFLEAMSELSARAISTLHIKEMSNRLSEDELEEALDELDAMVLVYRAIALSTLIGTVSSALHLGMIYTNTIESGVILKGEDDNE